MIFLQCLYRMKEYYFLCMSKVYFFPYLYVRGCHGNKTYIFPLMCYYLTTVNLIHTFCLKYSRIAHMDIWENKFCILCTWWISSFWQVIRWRGNAIWAFYNDILLNHTKMRIKLFVCFIIYTQYLYRMTDQFFLWIKSFNVLTLWFTISLLLPWYMNLYSTILSIMSNKRNFWKIIFVLLKWAMAGLKVLFWRLLRVFLS